MLNKQTNRLNGTAWAVLLSLLAVGSYTEAHSRDPVVDRVQTSTLRQQSVSGTVRDASTRETLPGVTITVKGSDQATQTNENGQYTVQASVGQVITASSIGYRSAEITVSGATADINLQTDQAALDEVVVVGYGTMRK